MLDRQRAVDPVAGARGANRSVEPSGTEAIQAISSAVTSREQSLGIDAGIVAADGRGGAVAVAGVLTAGAVAIVAGTGRSSPWSRRRRPVRQTDASERAAETVSIGGMSTGIGICREDLKHG